MEHSNRGNGPNPRTDGGIGTSETGPGSAPDRVRVVLADDDPLARRVVRDVLQDAGIIVIAEAATAREAVELALHYRPEIVVLDATMATTGIGAGSAMSRIIERCPEVRVVVFAASADDELGLQCLRAGASAFLTKEIDPASLPRALHGIVRGEFACSRAFVRTLVAQMRAVPQGGVGVRPVRSALTPREWEVLDLLCEGASTEAIAETLVLATETVRSHVKNLLRKLPAHSRQEAIELAPRLRSGDTTRPSQLDEIEAGAMDNRALTPVLA
jgi:NarL family two-component system response regulator LiaR